MSETSSTLRKSASIYKKLLTNGTLDKRQLEEVDYDDVVQYIKKSFPKATTLQRDIDQALKRTFVLGNCEVKNKSFGRPLHQPKTTVSRKTRLKRQKSVPKTLPYKDFLQLNSMWKDYIADLLQGYNQPDDIQQKLNKVDLHGASIEVVQAHCQDYSRLKGIVIKETRNTFVVVTPENVTKTIPKPENVFDLELREPTGTLRIAGNSFTTRPAERASKKIKSFMEFVGVRKYKAKLRYSHPH